MYINLHQSSFISHHINRRGGDDAMFRVSKDKYGVVYVLFVMISIKQKVQYKFENVYKYFIVTNYLPDSHELTRARALLRILQ